MKSAQKSSSSSSPSTPQKKKKKDPIFAADENGATMNPLFKANLDCLAEYGLRTTSSTPLNITLETSKKKESKQVKESKWNKLNVIISKIHKDSYNAINSSSHSFGKCVLFENLKTPQDNEFKNPIYPHKNMFLNPIRNSTELEDLKKTMEIFGKRVLPYCRLNGHIPDVFSNMSLTNDIQIGENSFSGNIQTFGKMTQLTTLSIFGNSFNGDFKALKKLVNLKILDARCNQFEDTLDSICPLKKLRDLLLERQSYGKSIYGQIPACMSDMKFLKIITLGDNKLSGHIIPEFLCSTSREYILINLTNNMYRNDTKYPSCFQAILLKYGQKGLYVNQRALSHNLYKYSVGGKAQLDNYLNYNRLVSKRIGMFWEYISCEKYVTNPIECKAAADANKPFDNNNGFAYAWHWPRTEHAFGCFHSRYNNKYYFNTNNYSVGYSHIRICAPTNCSTCRLSNISLPYEKTGYATYWSKIYGQYNKDYLITGDYYNLPIYQQTHFVLNGWSGWGQWKDHGNKRVIHEPSGHDITIWDELEKVLRNVGWNPVDLYPLRKCEGDCDSDAQCEGNLKCFEREIGETGFAVPPGCIAGGSGDVPGYDYCYLSS
eukprot:g2039.t1